MSDEYILCFGDSNTWGYIPGSGNRYPSTVRWPSVVSTKIAGHPALAHYSLIEDGLNGRTTAYPRRFRPASSARHSLPKRIEKLNSLAVLIIALGINDLKTTSAEQSSEMLEELVKISWSLHSALAILIISPPPIPAIHCRGQFANAQEESQKLSLLHKKLCMKHQLAHINCAELFEASPIDGIHYEAQSHLLLADAVLDRLVSTQQKPILRF